MHDILLYKGLGLEEQGLKIGSNVFKCDYYVNVYNRLKLYETIMLSETYLRSQICCFCFPTAIQVVPAAAHSGHPR